MASTIDSPQFSVVSPNLLSLAGEPHFWREEAPKKITSDEQWQVWSDHLTRRKQPEVFRAGNRSSSSPLCWGLGVSATSDVGSRLLESLEVQPKGQNGKPRKSKEVALEALELWSDNVSESNIGLSFALESLTVSQLLPRISDQLDEQSWWRYLEELLGIVSQVADWPVDAEMQAQDAVTNVLLAGELPLALANLFPEIKTCYKLRKAACEVVSESLLELTNGQGMVRGSYLSLFPLLFASWTRSLTYISKLSKSSVGSKAEEQYNWAVTQALRLSRDDGRWLLGEDDSAEWTPDFLAHVLELGGDRSDVAAALDIFGKKLTKHVTVRPSDRYPETSDNCEWACVANMRPDWERGEPTLVVDYSDPELRMEVASGAESLFKGVWSWETSVDNQPLHAHGTWEERCWFSDDDVDYLELSMELSNGSQLDRQILLARDENFLLLADYVMKTGGGETRHSFRLPLCEAVSFVPEQETCEGLLRTDRPLGRVLPLALPEWRLDSRCGELSATDDGLQLIQQRVGHNLACPLLIDLDRSRASKQCTWRQLTVAESLEIQPHDVAAGYRAQCGKQQWLFYRSLAAPANRSLLGQNISCECVVARFLAPAGEIEELLEIEA